MFVIIIGVFASFALVAFTIQTVRLGNRDIEIACLRNGEANLLRQRDDYYQRLQDTTVSRDGYAAMYEDACEAIEDGNTKLSRLRDDLDECKTLNSRSVIDKDKTIRHLTDSLSQQQTAVKQLKSRVNDLERRQCLKSHTRLSDGLGELIRFISANQWIMENNKSLAEAVASVSEVAEAITERED